MRFSLILSRRWRSPVAFWVMVGIEFAFSITILTLYAVAQPNLYRTQLRNEGARLGFNSDSRSALYAAANHTPYKDPPVWNQFITNYNVVISILALFILLTKATMFLLHCFIPIISLVIHILLVSLFAASTHIQGSPDLSDPKRPQPGLPWYLSKSCSIAGTSTLRGFCHQAKATYGLTIFMVIIYSAYLILSIHSLVPTEEQRARYYRKQADLNDVKEYHRHQQSVLRKHQLDFGEVHTPGLPPPMSATSISFSRFDGPAFNPFGDAASTGDRSLKGSPMRLW